MELTFNIALISLIINIILIFIIIRENNVISNLTPKYNIRKYRSNVAAFNKLQEQLLNEMSGETFEKFCCEVLLRDGYKDVKITRATGDFGIDVICTKGNLTYGIQCKCYSQAVGVHAVEEVYAGCAYYGCDVPVVMTSNYFTDSAQEMARVLRVELRGKSYLYNILHTNKKRK